jgi:hypothetical protein
MLALRGLEAEGERGRELNEAMEEFEVERTVGGAIIAGC